ncbi:hypothetical protein CB1_000353016 [Camelus ferus]|nr:hypothetical protein CB1_000353016 [Camelus ferus]
MRWYGPSLGRNSEQEILRDTSVGSICDSSHNQISKQQLQTVKDRFQAFLNGETQIVADEAFMNAVQSYYEVFLKSDRVARMVQSGGCSANDSREVFKKHIEKRVRSLPEIDGLSKETVLSSWMAKFDAIYRGEEDPRKQQARMTASAASELILSKEQLYEMFQNILGIKKFEHQLLYNACQAAVGNDSVSLVEEATCSEACVYCYGDNCDIGEKLSVGLFKSAFLSQIAQP